MLGKLMPAADTFLQHRDPFVREAAHWYAKGAFLMDNGDGPRFYSVESRALVPLTPQQGLHVSRRLRRELKHFEPRIDSAFEDVLQGCRGYLPGSPPRDGEWISDELASVYRHLHRHGLAHSLEVWRDGQLAGGILGLALGGAFIAESKFHRVSNASKAAVILFAKYLQQRGFSLLDAQIQNDHLKTLGVFEISSAEYQGLLRAALQQDVSLS